MDRAFDEDGNMRGGISELIGSVGLRYMVICGSAPPSRRTADFGPSNSGRPTGNEAFGPRPEWAIIAARDG
jgi:hypothetical protein